MKEYSSIFNHALAPITPGPSSSNTCGPVRIGLVSQQLLGSIPKDVVVEYDADGAFPSTLYGMRSDIAFINGLLGNEQNVPDFVDAYEKAAKVGMTIRFSEVNNLKVGGLETARLYMTAHDGTKLTVIGESLGGGAFKIHYIDDCPVDIQGMNYELVIFLRSNCREDAEAFAAEILGNVEALNRMDCVSGSCYAIVNLKAGAPFSKPLLEYLQQHENVSKVRVVNPIHPVVTDISRKPPFETPDGMIAYCDANGCSPARAAIDYEMAVSGWDEASVHRYGKMLIDIMQASRQGGYQSNLSFDGIVTPKANQIHESFQHAKSLRLGVLDEAIPSALGIMEYSNASGKIVCVPTGGSSGIVPGLLLSAAEDIHATEQELYEAMMCAGIVGVLMMVDGNEFSGGTHGCQVEVACGTAMASAGLVQLMGGSARQVCDAASMSLQCFMGLICDPVCGLVQVPCLARNMAGAAVAATSAKAVCAGFDVVLPLQETARAMIRTGTAITQAVGVSCSGCCMTPTGIRLTQQRESERSV